MFTVSNACRRQIKLIYVCMIVAYQPTKQRIRIYLWYTYTMLYIILCIYTCSYFINTFIAGMHRHIVPVIKRTNLFFFRCSIRWNKLFALKYFLLNKTIAEINLCLNNDESNSNLRNKTFSASRFHCISICISNVLYWNIRIYIFSSAINFHSAQLAKQIRINWF